MTGLSLVVVELHFFMHLSPILFLNFGIESRENAA